MSLAGELCKRGRPISIGLLGAGYMASGFMNVVQKVKGMRVVAVYDEDRDFAAKVVNQYASGAEIAYSPEDLCDRKDVEVVVDGTCNPSLGARVAQAAIACGKHVVSINIECDVTVGYALKAKARDAGIVYTVTVGDEPGELMRFYEHYTFLGFDVTALGKGKSNPLNHNANPETVKPSLPAVGITAEQVTSFVDGSKTMFEMGCIGNAVGFVPDVPGMHGPEARVGNLTRLFSLQEDGGLLSRCGVVDYVTGPDLSGGVFVIVRTEDRRLQSDLSYLKMGKGPYYAFYQPYHNWFIDMPISVARAVLRGEESVSLLSKPTCQVISVAKKDLNKGEPLGEIGGYGTYGVLYRMDEVKKEALLPHGLAGEATAAIDLPRGGPIRLGGVILNDSSDLVQLWRGLQEGSETGFSSLSPSKRKGPA